MAFLKAIKTRQIKKCIQHKNKKRRIQFQSVIDSNVCVKERSLVCPLFAGSMSAPQWHDVAESYCHLGSNVKADLFMGLEQVPKLNAKMHFL